MQSRMRDRTGVLAPNGMQRQESASSGAEVQFVSEGRHKPQVHTSPGPALTPLHETKLLVTDSRQGFGHPHVEAVVAEICGTGWHYAPNELARNNENSSTAQTQSLWS
jgi:hypothetical protein